MGVRGQITCQEIVEIVTEYLEGTLPPEERVRFEQHLLTCDLCVMYLDQMRETIRIAGRLTADALAPEQKELLLAAFRTWRDS